MMRASPLGWPAPHVPWRAVRGAERRLFVKRIILLTTTLALAMLATVTAYADPVTLMIDRAHSDVGFDVRHFFNKVHGSFTDYSGTISYDPKNLTVSTVSVTIRDSSINTRNDRRDTHLRSDDFFAVEKFPTITFQSTKIVPGKDDKHFQVIGDLTMRGVTKSVTLDAEFLGMQTMGQMGTQAGFMAKTTIPDRKEYGISWNRTLDQGGVMLGDDVDITLNIAAFAPDPSRMGGPPAKK
jgi:polyisoprenoid-binding protein YceI